MAQLQRQQEALKARMEGLPPSQRQRFLQSQQVLLTQLQQQVCAFAAADTGIFEGKERGGHVCCGFLLMPLTFQLNAAFIY